MKKTNGLIELYRSKSNKLNIFLFPFGWREWLHLSISRGFMNCLVINIGAIQIIFDSNPEWTCNA